MTILLLLVTLTFKGFIIRRIKYNISFVEFLIFYLILTYSISACIHKHRYTRCTDAFIPPVYKLKFKQYLCNRALTQTCASCIHTYMHIYLQEYWAGADLGCLLTFLYHRDGMVSEEEFIRMLQHSHWRPTVFLDTAVIRQSAWNWSGLGFRNLIFTVFWNEVETRRKQDSLQRIYIVFTKCKFIYCCLVIWVKNTHIYILCIESFARYLVYIFKYYFYIMTVTLK